jgi:hypothetical protein
MFNRALFVTLLAGYGADVEARDNKVGVKKGDPITGSSLYLYRPCGRLGCVIAPIYLISFLL